MLLLSTTEFKPILTINNIIQASPEKVAEIMMRWLTEQATYHTIGIKAAAKADNNIVTVNFTAPAYTGGSPESILCTATVTSKEVTIEQTHKMASNYVWNCFRSHLIMTIEKITEI